MNPSSADEMVYADSDYKDLYDYGPVSYQQASKQAAQKKKDEAAAKKAVGKPR